MSTRGADRIDTDRVHIPKDSIKGTFALRLSEHLQKCSPQCDNCAQLKS